MSAHQLTISISPLFLRNDSPISIKILPFVSNNPTHFKSYSVSSSRYASKVNYSKGQRFFHSRITCSADAAKVDVKNRSCIIKQKLRKFFFWSCVLCVFRWLEVLRKVIVFKFFLAGIQQGSEVVVKDKSVSVVLLAGGKGKRMGVSH